jgi:NAD(P)-dependent dehydrogenase (short-subunit alcohol dehydrogenase family)
MTTNTVALVTGVSSGIGRETAQLLAEHDARVFGTVRDLRRASPIARVDLIAMDVNDDGSVSEAVRSVLEKAGKIDMLICHSDMLGDLLTPRDLAVELQSAA